MNFRESISRLALVLALLPALPVAADVRQLSLPTKDMVYDRSRGKIYASVPSRAGERGNSVTVIDPEGGTIIASVLVGSEPGKLAISDDDRYLYVGLDGAGAVRRVDLATLSPGLQFSLGNGMDAPYRVDDMAVMPGHPETVAVSRGSLSSSVFHHGIVIYDQGVPRPKATDRHVGFVRIAFSSSPSRLYAYDPTNADFGFRRLAVDSEGVTLVDPMPVIGALGGEIVYDSGLVYSDGGRVIDPEAQLLIGSFVVPPHSPYPVTFALGAVAPDSEVGRVFFMTGDYMSPAVLAYEQQTFLPLGSLVIPGAGGIMGRLLRWGRNGLAFPDGQGQLYLIRTSLIPAEDLVLAFTPAAVQGGTPATGLIEIRGAAPAGGLTIPLSSDQPAAVPAQVLIPAGATTASFPVQTMPVASATSVTLSAAFRGRTWQATLPVLPRARFSLSLQVAGLIGSQSTTGLVTLATAAPPGGITVALSSDNPAVVVPANVTIAAGTNGARFPIATQYVTQRDPVVANITASYGEFSSASALTVLPLSVVLLSLEPTSVVGGSPVTGTVTLNIPAPPGGTPVPLSGSLPNVATVPPSVTVAAGQTTGSFSVTTYPVQTAAYASVGVWEGGPNTQAQLSVLPQVTRIHSILFDPNPVIGGHPVTGTVSLESPAPSGGVMVTLSSSRPDVALAPVTVSIDPGSTSAVFPITTLPVAADTPVTLSAATAAGTQTGLLIVLRAGIMTLALQPAIVVGGQTSTCTVTLSSPAPGTLGTPGSGVVISLLTDQEGTVGIPPWVVVPGGARSASFPIRTRPVTSVVHAAIIATYAGEARSVTLTVQPR